MIILAPLAFADAPTDDDASAARAPEAASPADPAAAAVVTTRKARVEVGVGIETDGTPDVGAITGVDVAGRVNVGLGLAVEADVYVRFPFVDPVSDLDRTLLNVAYQGDQDTAYRVPITTDAARVLVLANWGFIPRAAAGQFTGGPRLVGGLGVSAHVMNVATLSETFKSSGEGDPAAVQDDPQTVYTPLLAAGVAMDAWYAGRVGVQFRWLQQNWIAEAPDDGETGSVGVPAGAETQVWSVPTFDLSVIYAF